MTNTALTLGEAAKKVGKAKGTISRAISDGRLSAKKNDDGKSYAIEPVELFRVWPPVLDTTTVTDNPINPKTEQHTTPNLQMIIDDKEVVISELQKRIEGLEADKKKANEESDRWYGEHQRAQKLLTDQMEKPKGLFARIFNI